MTKKEIIEILKSDSCYECTYGTVGMADCTCENCNLKKAIIEVIAAIKESMTIPSTIEITTWNDTTRQFVDGVVLTNE